MHVSEPGLCPVMFSGDVAVLRWRSSLDGRN